MLYSLYAYVNILLATDEQTDTQMSRQTARQTDSSRDGLYHICLQLKDITASNCLNCCFNISAMKCNESQMKVCENLDRIRKMESF